ncbi:MAG TPA: phage tail protein [Candidatus Limnocylindria bacterium]|nr:phage tail protein [Candidatus Limnocylindria bacterium]
MNRLVLATLMVATIVLGSAASGAPARNDDVRLSSFQVAITFDGMATAYFRSVAGLSVEIEVVEFREGGQNEVTHKLPGRVKYPNLVLKQGFTGSAGDLLKWTLRIAAGTPEAKNGSIAVYDAKGQPVATYTIANAWPVKWEGPDFDASSNEVAIETIEIAHEGLRLTDP